MSNIYLVGHGARRGWGDHKLKKIPIPPGISLIFYCQDGVRFDGHWEATIRKKLAAGETPKRDDLGIYSPEEYQREVWHDQMYDYCLGFPGEVTGALLPTQLKALETEGIPAAQVADRSCLESTYRVGDRQSPVIGLGTILQSLNALHGEVTVHWFACREYLPTEAAFDEWLRVIVKGDYTLMRPTAERQAGRKMDPARMAALAARIGAKR